MYYSSWPQDGGELFTPSHEQLQTKKINRKQGKNMIIKQRYFYW
jgi:hypothetical protein